MHSTGDIIQSQRYMYFSVISFKMYNANINQRENWVYCTKKKKRFLLKTDTRGKEGQFIMIKSGLYYEDIIIIYAPNKTIEKCMEEKN